MVHGRRMMRALGGVSQTVRGWRTLRQVLSIKSILAGWALLRQMGVLGIFSQASVAARTLAGSFAFLRLVVSSCIRGWEEGLNAIRALALSAASLLGGGDASSPAVCTAEAAAVAGGDGKAASSRRWVEKKYQARGRNPLAPSLSWLMRSASSGGGDKAGVETGADSACPPASEPGRVLTGHEYKDGSGGSIRETEG